MQSSHPTKVCVGCSKSITKLGFAKRQWKSEHPTCRECSEKVHDDVPPTKTCAQCKESRGKDQYPKKEWKREDALCRVCFEYAIISDELTRQCHDCKLDLPRSQYNIHQWDKGSDALCHGCREALTKKCIESIGTSTVTTQQDDTCLCSHSLERCAICMVDYTLLNKFARKRASLGRDLTDDENEAITAEFMKESGIHINSKICIMDGQSMCPRSGRKLRCPCNEVTYCSEACQRHHWTIHKMTCKALAKKKKKKKKPTQATSAQPAHGLTEEELEYIRIEAFMAENKGVKHAIEECAWQLGEHPLVIGGGQIRYGPNGEEFKKGDVGKIYREEIGVEWDVFWQQNKQLHF
eukprot:scaffold2468_cov133-Skeletonema_marinoi.AAC.8